MTTNRKAALSAAVLSALTVFSRAKALRAEEGAPPPAVPPLPVASPAALPTSPPDPEDTPAPALVALGTHRAYRPLLRFEPRGMQIQGDFLVAFRAEGTSTYPVDRDGSGYQAGAVLAPMLRAGLRFDSGTAIKQVGIHAEYEHDLPTGYWTSDTPIEGAEMPATAPIEQQIRKLYLRVSLGPYLHVGGGFMTNQFGLGLLANDGAQGNWAPGTARFADNRGGDRVLRGFIGTGPLTSAAITATFAVDKVQGDDVLLPGDEAFQVIGTASVGYGQPWGAGIFVVHRRQDAPDGGRTDATVVDLTARYAGAVPAFQYTFESEVAFVVGETTLGPTAEFPVHRLRQIGGAARGSVRRRNVGGVLDILFATGDGKPDDGMQTAFKADPNFETGLLLYRQVIAAQTGRATVTAANPDLVGVPSQGLERVPTRGAPTNTVALFPRVFVRPTDGLEAYGGVLFAWSQAKMVDPLNTRFNGGIAKNALDGSPGDYLGTELDVGVRQRLLLGGTELTVGVEGAVLLPGDAFTDAQGSAMGPVFGGRALFNYRL